MASNICRIFPRTPMVIATSQRKFRAYFSITIKPTVGLANTPRKLSILARPSNHSVIKDLPKLNADRTTLLLAFSGLKVAASIKSFQSSISKRRSCNPAVGRYAAASADLRLNRPRLFSD
ncbi:hypothetical protein MVEN_00102300 [Mycena venus]|uniref:Uncharacterized protein n=1 Tax=Mycena venus TaxID=2733690 RepID=A0A8H6Z7X9_9AGAR|nr:hypothetical protein MVEN_00102300 [Mycena venus]